MIVENSDDAKRIGLESRNGGRITVWTDGSQMEDGDIVRIIRIR
jgi:hypothetical protein